MPRISAANEQAVRALVPRAECPMEGAFLGRRAVTTCTSAISLIHLTYNTDDSTWLWAWENPSVADSLTAHSIVVSQYVEKRKIAELTTPKLQTAEEKAWEFSALTCKRGKYQGVYRGPAGPTMVFITFGEVRLKKRRGQ